jgi:hypothetical protein
MTYKPVESPWVVAITSGLSMVATIVNSLAKLDGMTPFWADVLVTLALACALFHWMFFLYAKAKRPPNINEAPTQRRKATALSFGGRMLSSLAVPLVLCGLMLWTLEPLVSHLRGNAHWSVCGTFVGACQTRSSVQLFDLRRRPLGECFATHDDTGYLQERGGGVTGYRPAFIKDCNCPRAIFVKLPPEAFSERCHGVLELR